MAIIRNNELPTFDRMSSKALDAATEAADWLRSDWRAGHGPSDEQAEAKSEAVRHLALAIAALERAVLSHG